MYGYKPVIRGLDRCLTIDEITLIPTMGGDLFLKRSEAAEKLTLTRC